MRSRPTLAGRGLRRSMRRAARRTARSVNGAPGAIRTRDPCLRRAILYPAELRAPIKILPIFVATRRSALGHSLVTPLNVRIDRLLEVADFADFSARFEPLVDFFGGRHSIQLSYGRTNRGRDSTRRTSAASTAANGGRRRAFGGRVRRTEPRNFR